MSVSLKGLGFTNMNCILTLKNAGQMLFLNICFVLLFIALFIKFKISGLRKDHSNQQKLMDKMFFAPFLGIGFRLFIPMSISSYLNMNYQLIDDKGYIGDIVSDYFAILIAILVCVWFPISMIYVALVPKKWLSRPDFKQKWGFLFTSIKTDNFMQRAYFLMFIFRRAVLVFTGLMMSNYPAIQVQCTMGCNILLLIWSAKA